MSTLINEIVEITLFQKFIITWIVIGWLLIAYYILKPLHGMPAWKNVVRGIGEITLGSLWMILCVVLLHFVPGFAIMLVVAFCFFHCTRSVLDIRSCERKDVPRKLVGKVVLSVLLAALILDHCLGFDPIFNIKRGVAQLTSNTVFPDAGKSCKHWFACDCTYPMRRTGIRPSESKAAFADSSFLLSRMKKISLSSSVTISKKQTPAKAK